MKLFVNVKQAGSRKNHIAKEEINFESVPGTLRELIEIIVKKNLEEFNEKVRGKTLVDYLTKDEIEDKAVMGKVSFGEAYNTNKESLKKALENAFQAYEDGIYRVFINEEEAAELDAPVQICQGDVLTFIRLTMLAGRMW